MTIPAGSKSGDGNHPWSGRDHGSLTYGLALFGLIGAAAATVAVTAIPFSYLFLEFWCLPFRIRVLDSSWVASDTSAFLPLNTLICYVSITMRRRENGRWDIRRDEEGENSEETREKKRRGYHRERFLPLNFP